MPWHIYQWESSILSTWVETTKVCRPKLRFPTCPAYQNIIFPIYTYLAEDRAELYEMCRKFCPIL